MASNVLATPRRSKTMPTEGHMTRFLYAILKQLDLKTIDWSDVATDLEISNGHAARMRYSRFRQQMEGTISVSRNPKPKKATGRADSGKGDIRKGAKPSKAGDSSDKKKRFGMHSNNKSIGNTKRVADMEKNPKKRLAPDDFVKLEAVDFNSFMRREPAADFRANPYQYPMTNIMTPNRMMPASNNSLLFAPMQYPISQSPSTMAMNTDNTMVNQSPFPGSSQIYNTEAIGNTPNWNQSTDFCFSGCCQPCYPSTPTMYPTYPATYSTSSSSTQFQPQQTQPLEVQPLVPRPQNIWVPVKQDDGYGGASDDVLVKVEAGTGLET
ncbi:hypothetical protein BGW36DRAFT_357870 [Talaromyces proteolyticus]|uniref:Myb-like DNA-binding domain-containing protein n=1 Tax=Talaromyces proteolyticus TaxID=1131652 RepID=A0AAD4KXI1_9EURO|nr:uncharacterized protein BGW36DRAFT_357870 [Talaromyces proteolyticus]KAH8698331.1 hypothetical protein BGW36DRAFT_357870 [Talaromyces proteolyticus]